MEEARKEGSAFTCTGQIGMARKEVMEWGSDRKEGKAHVCH